MRLNTPVELHLLKDRNVYVKRDDLMGDGDTLPPRAILLFAGAIPLRGALLPLAISSSRVSPGGPPEKRPPSGWDYGNTR